MSKIVVLFNVKEGVDLEVYENWARTTDMPTVNNLASIDNFDVLRMTSILGSDQAPPYQYIEVLHVNDLDVFGVETSTEVMKKVANAFQAFADAPLFIVTEHI